MANPTLLTMPLCVNADKNTIPPTDAGTSGLFSEEYGWQNINSLPLASGGKAPNRRDFNGVFALLGGIAYMAQKGWQFEFDETQDYFAGCIVRDTLDGKLYECINDVTASTTHPHTDSTNWKSTAIDTSNFANTQLSNLDTANLSYHLVVDSYYNDTTGDWYRVYDDGWVEQGGYITSANGVVANITLLKPYKDTNYIVSKGFNTTSSSYYGAAADAHFYTAYNKTQTSFITGSRPSDVIGNTWTACGMGATV